MVFSVLVVQQVINMTQEEKRIKDRQNYADNPDYYRAKALKYTRKNREARAEYTRKYRENNREKVAASKAACRKSNPEIDAAYAKAYRKRNPEKHKETYKRQNLKKYGLTPEGKTGLCEKQNNKCKICLNNFLNSRDTHVDHDHTTGVIRGILCSSCNLLLGHAKDNKDILKSAIKYLALSGAAVD